MSTRQRGAIFVLSVVSVVVVGAIGVRAIRREPAPEWPGRVALLGINEDNPRQPVTFMAVVHPGTRAVAIVAPDAVVEVPGAGFLRAFHAYRLGGADLAQETLGRLFGVDVPFSARGPGTDLESVAASVVTTNVPAGATDELRGVLDEAVATWERREVTGERRQGDQGTYLILNPASVQDAASAIGGLGTKVFVDPSQVEGESLVDRAPEEPAESAAPSPEPEARIDPKEISVQVLNGGEVEMAATKTSNRLKESGYTLVGPPGDFLPQDRPQSVVYFRDGQEAEARQVGAELGYPVEPVPDEIQPKMRAGAEVLVLLGHDARV